jgi:hypothetical protein
VYTAASVVQKQTLRLPQRIVLTNKIFSLTSFLNYP